ncbi:hypothetical protein BpHYR1_030731 [Brachionus plicatilis]|uniref:Uncharacterized protein n=1 Tax=Brachionus plicatilis TaxID=10195 RepID=A0A3M7RI51_BRAPC|nr:hypothetical protein BpHYR1_030731 [Brachionus plicatilis]
MYLKIMKKVNFLKQIFGILKLMINSKRKPFPANFGRPFLGLLTNSSDSNKFFYLWRAKN